MRALAQCITSRQAKGIILDEKTVLFSVKNCIKEQFGQQGEKNIEPLSWKKGIISVKISKAVWSSELWQQKEQFIQCCNQKFLPERPVKKITIYS